MAPYQCTFCGRTAPGKWALTACDGDPTSAESWRREVLPVCPRCNRLLDDGGAEGRVHKATGARWYGGHTVGVFESKQFPLGGNESKGAPGAG